MAGGKKMNDEERHNLYSSSNDVSVIKLKEDEGENTLVHMYQVRKTKGISVWEAVKGIYHLKTQDVVMLNSGVK